VHALIFFGIRVEQGDYYGIFVVFLSAMNMKYYWYRAIPELQ